MKTSKISYQKLLDNGILPSKLTNKVKELDRCLLGKGRYQTLIIWTIINLKIYKNGKERPVKVNGVTEQIRLILLKTNNNN